VSRSNVKCGNKWVNKNNTARRLCFPPQRAQNRTSPGGQRVQISAAKTDNFDLTARALVINTGGQKLAVPGPVLPGKGANQAAAGGTFLPSKQNSKKEHRNHRTQKPHPPKLRIFTTTRVRLLTTPKPPPAHALPTKSPPALAHGTIPAMLN
jgi:hypothetical protein